MKIMDDSMDAQIVLIYSLVDDILKASHHYENPQCLMTDAEVCTTAIVAMIYFGGNCCLFQKITVCSFLNSKYVRQKSF
jgi:hypothetical protein